MALTGWSASNLIRNSGAVVSAVPLTMSCWFYPTANATAQLMMLCQAAATGDNHQFLLRTNASGNVDVGVGDGAGGVSVSSTATHTNNAWNHAAGVFTSSTSRTVYLNGGNSASETTNKTPASLDRTSIGLRDNALADRPWQSTGRIAEAALWNVALNADEIAALARGFAPSLIRPQSLVAYLPIIRAVQDAKGDAFSVVGSLSVADHCRVSRPAA